MRPSGCHEGVASDVAFTPFGDLTATDVQAAIEELVRPSCAGLDDLGPVTDCVDEVAHAAPGTITVDAAAFPVVVVTAAAAGTVAFTWQTTAPDVRNQTVVLTVVASGADRTITWPAEVVWPGGVAPAMPLASGTTSQFVFTTVDDGTVVLGNVVGLEYA